MCSCLVRVEDARLAVRLDLEDASLGPGAGIKDLALRIVGEAPDIGIQVLGQDDGLVGADADHGAARPSAGEDGAVGRLRQTQHLAIAAGIDDVRLAIRGDLEDLAFQARGHDQVAGPILDHVPDMRGLQAGQGFDLLGQPQRAFAADHGLLELGLFKMALVVVLPDLHLGSIEIGRGKKHHAKKAREDRKSCHEDETSKGLRD